MPKYVTNPDGSYSVEFSPGRWVRTAVNPEGGFDQMEKLGGFASPGAEAMQGVQDPRVAGTAHEPAPAPTQAERFDALDKLGTGPGSAPVPPRSSAPAAFARSAAAAALDTAALPVTVPAKLYRAAGGRGETLDTIADLQADEALQDATWLATGEEAGDYRARVKAEREQFPNASAAGAELGAAAGGVGLGGLAERGVARGIASASDAAAFLRKHPKGEAVELLTNNSESTNQYLRKRATGQVPERGRSPHPEKRAADATEALEAAIAAGHVHDGPVIRGLDLPEETLNEWLDKGAIRNASFLSTSSDPRYLDDFFGKPSKGQAQVILRIEDSGGVPISGISHHASESEVMIPPGRDWSIVGQSQDAAGRTVLDLKRVESAPGAAITFDASGPVTGQARTATREQAQEKQRRYSAEPFTLAGRARRIAEQTR